MRYCAKCGGRGVSGRAHLTKSDFPEARLASHVEGVSSVVAEAAARPRRRRRDARTNNMVCEKP